MLGHRTIEVESLITIIVAVAARRPSSSEAPSFPPQQSPIFGQRASSQTVCRFSPLRSFLILLYEAPVGIFVFRKPGRRGLGHHPVKIKLHDLGQSTHPFVFPSTTFSMGSPEMKSSNEGPLARTWLKRDSFVFELDGVAKHRA